MSLSWIKYFSAHSISSLASGNWRASKQLLEKKPELYLAPLSKEFKPFRCLEPHHAMSHSVSRNWGNGLQDADFCGTHILIDMSDTMAFTHEHGSKFEYAGFVAIALAQLVKVAESQVRVSFINDKLQQNLEISTNDSIVRLFDAVQNVVPTGAVDCDAVVKSLTDNACQPQTLFVISDFASNQDGWASAVRALVCHQNEVVLFHIMDPVELDFNLQGRIKLADWIKGQNMKVFGPSIRPIYNRLCHEYLRAFHLSVASMDGEHILCRTDKSLGYNIACHLDERLSWGR